MNNIILEMEEYASINNVPIMLKDTIYYINNIINERKIETILEIGTAIAYSTINFASNISVKRITSIERDEIRHNEAIKNVEKSSLNNIELIKGDALEVEIKDKYDLIIIDAAKSQNIKFFEKYKNNLKDNGILIVDNMNFHDLVGKSESIKSKNLRALVRKLEAFWDFIDSQTDYEVKHLDIGDGLVICKKKNI